MAVQGYVAAGPAGTSTPIRCPCRTTRSGRTRSRVPRGGARLAVARAGAAAALAPTIPYVSRHGRGAQRFAG